MGDFPTHNNSALRVGKTELFFLLRASATKNWEKSRIFMYGLPLDFVSKGQKTTAGGGRKAPPPHALNRLHYVQKRFLVCNQIYVSLPLRSGHQLYNFYCHGKNF